MSDIADRESDWSDVDFAFAFDAEGENRLDSQGQKRVIAQLQCPPGRDVVVETLLVLWSKGKAERQA